MPCTTYSQDEQMNEDQNTLARLSRMLCDSCTLLDRLHVVLPPSCKVWWAAHQREDLLRQQAEDEATSGLARRQLILAKLTPEERRVLGL